MYTQDLLKKEFLSGCLNVKGAIHCLANGVGIDVCDSSYNTALHHAAMEGNNELARFLVSRGANMELKNLHNLTAEEEAWVCEEEKTAKLLKGLRVG